MNGLHLLMNQVVGRRVRDLSRSSEGRGHVLIREIRHLLAEKTALVTEQGSYRPWFQESPPSNNPYCRLQWAVGGGVESNEHAKYKVPGTFGISKPYSKVGGLRDGVLYQFDLTLGEKGEILTMKGDRFAPFITGCAVTRNGAEGGTRWGRCLSIFRYPWPCEGTKDGGVPD